MSSEKIIRIKNPVVTYHQIDSENDEETSKIRKLVDDYILEPYSKYVYHFFVGQWPNYCIVAKNKNNEIIAVIISKVESHRNVRLRGYIGMIVVLPEYRGNGIANCLIKLTIRDMIERDKVDEIMLETEVINTGALRLYEKYGFLKTKRLFRYYLNQHDAFRLILPVTEKSLYRSKFL